MGTLRSVINTRIRACMFCQGTLMYHLPVAYLDYTIRVDEPDPLMD